MFGKKIFEEMSFLSFIFTILFCVAALSTNSLAQIPGATRVTSGLRSCEISSQMPQIGDVGGCGELSAALITSGGVASISVSHGYGGAIDFIAHRDEQPTAGRYITHVTELVHTSRSREYSYRVSGICEIMMSDSGSHWRTGRCRVSDRNGRETNLRFQGDGRPFRLQRL
jgi:hypothetical protein